MTALSFPRTTSLGEASGVRMVSRLTIGDDFVREVEIDGGAVVTWRARRTETSLPVLELHLPTAAGVDLRAPLPFIEHAASHDALLVAASSRPGETADVERLFPLSIASVSLPPEPLTDLAMLWVLHDGPFGTFAWSNVFRDGRCVSNQARPVDQVPRGPWDVVAEVDYADCARAFLGELEIRDLIARGHLKGPLSALSALTWFVERHETTGRAAAMRDPVELLLEWVAVARSDEVLSWVAAGPPAAPEP